MGNVTDTELSSAEIRDLQRVAGIMIPADEMYRVPGADDPTIISDIVGTLGRDTADVRAALRELAGLAGAPFGELDNARAGSIALQLLASGSRPALALGRVVLAAYYRDDRVVRSLGREPRPPFPKGHELQDGDWSLLEAVKGLPQLWRDDRRA